MKKWTNVLEKDPFGGYKYQHVFFFIGKYNCYKFLETV